MVAVNKNEPRHFITGNDLLNAVAAQTYVQSAVVDNLANTIWLTVKQRHCV
jgi:hypothetical protein